MGGVEGMKGGCAGSACLWVVWDGDVCGLDGEILVYIEIYLQAAATEGNAEQTTCCHKKEEAAPRS